MTTGGYEALFGEECTSLIKGEEEMAVSSLNGKVVGLYFSAHWCGPCRGFTPKLVEIYNKQKELGNEFEIVFCSSDQGQTDFDSYFKEMPWCAVPYKFRELKNELSTKFNVRGIPSLIILDGEANIINESGRGAVQNLEYPFAPPTFEDCIAGPLLNKSGETVQYSDVVNGKNHVAVYFGQNVAEPCKKFTPTCNSVRNACVANMEVICVCLDKEKEDFDAFVKTMDGYCIPFEDKRIGLLVERAGLRTIPEVNLYTVDGTLARGSLHELWQKDESGTEYPWPIPNILSFSDGLDALNERQCFMVFHETLTKEQQDQNMAAFQTLAAEEAAAPKRSYTIYNCNESHPVVQKIRNSCSINDPKLIILDIPDRGGFYAVDIPKTEEDLNTIISDLKSKKLQRQQLKS